MKNVGFWIWDSEPEKLVDPGWNPFERVAVIRYLEAGKILETYLGSAYCRMGCFGGKMASQMGSRDLTDGIWIWPEGFTHYLEVHQVKPPAEFVRWALAENHRKVKGL